MSVAGFFSGVLLITVREECGDGVSCVALLGVTVVLFWTTFDDPWVSSLVMNVDEVLFGNAVAELPIKGDEASLMDFVTITSGDGVTVFFSAF